MVNRGNRMNLLFMLLALTAVGGRDVELLYGLKDSAKKRCPVCKSTGLQVKENNIYKCKNCGWVGQLKTHEAPT